jgi:hypothetical protein
MLPIIVVTVINVIFESSHLTAEILADKYLSLAHLKFKFPIPALSLKLRTFLFFSLFFGIQD